jgi:hypothetical protein
MKQLRELSLDLIKTMAHSNDNSVRIMAFKASEGNENVPIDILEQGAKDKEITVRRAAIEALKTRAFKPDFARSLLKSKSYLDRLSALELYEGADIVPQDIIESALSDPDCKVREQGVKLFRSTDPNYSIIRKLLEKRGFGHRSDLVLAIAGRPDIPMDILATLLNSRDLCSETINLLFRPANDILYMSDQEVLDLVDKIKSESTKHTLLVYYAYRFTDIYNKDVILKLLSKGEDGAFDIANTIIRGYNLSLEQIEDLANVKTPQPMAAIAAMYAISRRGDVPFSFVKPFLNSDNEKVRFHAMTTACYNRKDIPAMYYEEWLKTKNYANTDVTAMLRNNCTESLIIELLASDSSLVRRAAADAYKHACSTKEKKFSKDGRKTIVTLAIHDPDPMVREVLAEEALSRGMLFRGFEPPEFVYAKCYGRDVYAKLSIPADASVRGNPANGVTRYPYRTDKAKIVEICGELCGQKIAIFKDGPNNNVYEEGDEVIATNFRKKVVPQCDDKDSICFWLSVSDLFKYEPN